MGDSCLQGNEFWETCYLSLSAGGPLARGKGGIWLAKYLDLELHQFNVGFIAENFHWLISNWGPVHDTPETFENVVLFQRLGHCRVHTNPSRKWSFSKTLFKPEEFENAGLAF